jgi:Protein of unknown function (DUF3987)
MGRVEPWQRWTRHRPCPICEGRPTDAPRHGVRCTGFLSKDGFYAHCTREERAGEIAPTNASEPTYPHLLRGPCRCGTRHDGREAAEIVRDLPPRTPRHPTLGEPTSAYPIRYFDGSLAAIHYRWDYSDGREKKLRWYRNGKWSLEPLLAEDLPLEGTELLRGLKPGATVYVCEGEKAAKALRDRGLHAVGTVTGAPNAPCRDALAVLGLFSPVLWEDNDDKGRQQQEKIVASLQSLHVPYRHVNWPDAPPKGDAADFEGANEDIEAMTEGGEDDSPVEPWGEPIPLPEVRVPVQPFDYALLPDPLAPWVKDIAERVSQPPDIAAVGALVALSSLVGRRCGIYPKRHDDWLVIPNLWGMGVAPPATLKSPMLEQVMHPLDRLATDAHNDYQAALAEHEEKQAMYDARKKGRKEAMQKAAKDRDEVRQAEIEADKLPPPPVPPKKRRFKTNDATTEKIGEILAENPNGILAYRDELSGLLYSLEKNNHEGDRQFYLESWNAKGSYDVDRIGRGELHIPAICLSLLGGIQPGPLARYVADAASEDAGNDGLIQRFQLLVWPNQPEAFVYVDRYPDRGAQKIAYAVFDRLAELVPERYGARGQDDSEIPALRFDAEAQAVFDEWYVELQNRLYKHDMHPALEAHLAKYASLMPSLALLFHLAECVTSEYTTARAVTKESANRAAAWCAYLETHANRLYDSAINPGAVRARDLMAHIESGEVTDKATVREIMRHCWSGLTNGEEVEAAITTLEEYGWVHLEEWQPTTGRPSKVLRIHPDLLSR